MDLSLFLSTQPEALLRFFPMDAPCRGNLTGPLFLLTTAGEATVEIDGRPYTLCNSTLLTLLPYHLLYTLDFTPDFRCLTLAFTFDFMADFPYMLQSCISEQIEMTPFVQLISPEYARLASLYQSITCHYQLTTHPSYQEILRSQLYIFTAEVSAIYSNKPIKSSATRNEEITGGFFRLLHEHFRTNRDAAFYADRLCISTKHLSKVIQQITSHLPTYWIAHFTVREAMSLLKATTLTVTQLSEELNFPNSSFFARYFKRYAGVSPQAFRSNGTKIV